MEEILKQEKCKTSFQLINLGMIQFLFCLSCWQLSAQIVTSVSLGSCSHSCIPSHIFSLFLYVHSIVFSSVTLITQYCYLLTSLGILKFSPHLSLPYSFTVSKIQLGITDFSGEFEIQILATQQVYICILKPHQSQNICL